MSADLSDQIDSLPPSAMKNELIRYIKTAGVVAATRAAIDVLGDKKAPAAAKATMASLVFKIAGFGEKSDDVDDPFGLRKMSSEELAETLPRLERVAVETERRIVERQKLLDKSDAEELDIFA